MDYHAIYSRLIIRGKNRILEGYTEVHHIIPKCMGGTNTLSNLVKLTPEEHYVAHQLLVKIFPDNRQLVYAAQMMIVNRPNNKMYGWLKRRYQAVRSEQSTGEGNTQFGTCWINNGVIAKKLGKFDIMPCGYRKGRSIKWANKKCKMCDKNLSDELSTSSYCSQECKYNNTYAIHNLPKPEVIERAIASWDKFQSGDYKSASEFCRLDDTYTSHQHMFNHWNLYVEGYRKYKLQGQDGNGRDCKSQARK